MHVFDVERKAVGESFLMKHVIYYLGVAPERVCRMSTLQMRVHIRSDMNKGGTACKTDVL